MGPVGFIGGNRAFFKKNEGYFAGYSSPGIGIFPSFIVYSGIVGRTTFCADFFAGLGGSGIYVSNYMCSRTLDSSAIVASNASRGSNYGVSGVFSGAFYFLITLKGAAFFLANFFFIVFYRECMSS